MADLAIDKQNLVSLKLIAYDFFKTGCCKQLSCAYVLRSVEANPVFFVSFYPGRGTLKFEGCLWYTEDLRPSYLEWYIGNPGKEYLKERIGLFYYISICVLWILVIYKYRWLSSLSVFRLIMWLWFFLSFIYLDVL